MPGSRDELIHLSATEAVARLKRGDITPLDLIEAAERRIAEVEPAINALPTLCFARAREHAHALMRGERREAEGEPGWLGGLPLAIKDLADVAGVRTTYGSPIFRDHVPTASHPVVERIERRGGIVIAKSNTPEFGAGGSTFNEVFGRTRNPWNTALTSGGSTGGGAAALATGMIAIAEGTDLGGSLRIPAAFCGVVGLRPSPGLVPTWPSEYLWDTMQVTGAIARRAEDIALALQGIAGPSARVPIVQPLAGRDFVAAVANAKASGLRLAYTADLARIGIDPAVESVCRDAAFGLAQAGARVEEIRP